MKKVKCIIDKKNNVKFIDSFNTVKEKTMIKKKITQMLIVGLTTLFATNGVFAQSKVIEVDSFNEIIISPHIEVIFKKGAKESVEINELKLPMEKFNIEVKKNILHIFLEGAKISTETKKVVKNGEKIKVPIYQGTQAKITVTYKDVETYSLRGEEKIVFEDALEKDKLKFNIYGESKIYIKDANINDFKIAIYGESYLEILKGIIKEQNISAYGGSSINMLGVSNETTKITAYGDGDYKFNISNLLKVTAYGDVNVSYKGNPTLKKGLIIGDAIIKMIN